MNTQLYGMYHSERYQRELDSDHASKSERLSDCYAVRNKYIPLVLRNRKSNPFLAGKFQALIDDVQREIDELTDVLNPDPEILEAGGALLDGLMAAVAIVYDPEFEATVGDAIEAGIENDEIIEWLKDDRQDASQDTTSASLRDSGYGEGGIL